MTVTQPTILDTSTLITLALAQRDQNIHKRDSHSMHAAYGGLDEAIQAFILHDNLVFDGPSVRRNIDELPQLSGYCKLGAQLWKEDLTLEQRIYQSLLDTYVPRMEASENAIDLFRLHTEEWMAREVGVTTYYPSARWRDIESELTPQGMQLASELRRLFGNQTPFSGAACALLLRTLYYDRLQQMTSANLILHPLKGELIARIGKDSALAPSVMEESAGSDHLLNILDIFDQSVRKAFYERKNKWLGRNDLSYDVPLLTAYVLNKCREWADLSKVIEDVRESKQAVGFRRGIRDLLSASEDHRNEDVEDILQALSSAADRWSKDIREPRVTKKVKISVPIIGIGLDVDVPDKKLNRKASDRILVFVHMLLEHS